MPPKAIPNGTLDLMPRMHHIFPCLKSTLGLIVGTLIGVTGVASDDAHSTTKAWVDVTASGADSTGHNDASKSIKSALTGCREQCVLFFPPGTYRVSEQVRISISHLKVLGPGARIVSSLANHCSVFTASDQMDISFQGLRLEEHT